MTRRSAIATQLAVAAALSGCARDAAPSLIFAGAYFPLWMACALAGVIFALVLRLALGRLGFDSKIAFRLAFYTAAALLASTALWLLRAKASS